MNYVDTYFPDGTYTDLDLKNKNLLDIVLDNAFYLDSDIILNDDAHTVKIIRYNMPYIVLYNGIYANRNSIAIEPMTGAPNVFNNHIGLINLKKNHEFKCGYSVELLK
jgi:aldose 1-epimerase